MILFLVFIVIMALPAVWLFARTKPATSRVDLLRRFNGFTWFFVMFAGASAWIYLTQGAGPGATPGVSPYLATIGAVATGSSVLLLAALVRILVFRRYR